MAATVHVKRRLTDISLHFPWDFTSIGEAFFPRRPTPHLTDQFVNWNKANLLALDELTPLGDDDTPPNVELVLSADTSFSCKVYGVAHPGKWITERNADPSLDYETERTIQLTTALRLRLEYLQVYQTLRSTAIMTNNSTLTAAQRFDNYTSSNSKPISQMQLIVDTIGYANQGRKPNRIAMTTFTMRAIAKSEEFKDLVKYNVVQNAQLAELNKSMQGQIALIEQLIGVAPGSIMLSDAVYNAAAASQTANYVTFIGPDILFGYIEPLGIRSYSLAAGFQWSAYSNDPQAIIAVPRYTNTMVPVEDLRAFTVIDTKVIQVDLGYLLKGAINSADTTSYGNLVSV
jgi:hypothetical protein